MSHQPYQHPADDPIFRDKIIGFRVTTDDGTVFVPFRVTRAPGAPPPEWQGGGRILAQDPVPGSSRVLIEDMGAEPMTFGARLVFQTAEHVATLMALLPYEGTLILDAAWTREPADRIQHLGARDYAEFDGVRIVGMPSLRTFDLRGVTHLDIVFQREAPERPVKVLAWS